MTALAHIQQAMSVHEPRLLPPGDKRHAAVALVFREIDGELLLLFIERARREGDPWSGHIAFPGGRIETDDPDARRAAERETREEIGLVLNAADCLGRLDDVTGATISVLVSGFVYGIGPPACFKLNEEVRQAFWVSVRDLADPERHITRTFRYRGQERRHPAVDVLGAGHAVLWGLTYRFTVQILNRLGYDIPPAP